MKILALDQGTTNTKALVFDAAGRIMARASANVATAYPKPGWAEQSASDIWAATQDVISQAVAQAGPVDAIGIANQRETLVVWDAQTGAPVAPAPLWQCRRTADLCAELLAQPDSALVAERSGLGINPLFPATKLHWVLENIPKAADLHAQGRLRAGTVDSWLIWKLTGGTEFKTDHSNASRTLLFDRHRLTFSPALAQFFNVPLDCLATPVASDGYFGATAAGATALPEGIPICAVMGDSHAALFGHGVRAPGLIKATYGTGTSLMTASHTPPPPENGLSATIAWTQGDQALHALEGNITVSGQAAAFAANLLGLADVQALSALAQTVPDAGGCTFVPALAGLGAPYWDDQARGMIAGMSLGTKPAHIARAALDAIAHQVADVFEAMEAAAGAPLAGLSVDGGGAMNDWLMARQADLLGVEVLRPEIAETGAYGVASMAAERLGSPLLNSHAKRDSFAPRLKAEERESERFAWRQAVSRARFQPTQTG